MLVTLSFYQDRLKNNGVISVSIKNTFIFYIMTDIKSIICLFLYLSIFLSDYLAICLFIYPSIYFHLSMYLYIYYTFRKHLAVYRASVYYQYACRQDRVCHLDPVLYQSKPSDRCQEIRCSYGIADFDLKINQN